MLPLPITADAPPPIVDSIVPSPIDPQIKYDKIAMPSISDYCNQLECNSSFLQTKRRVVPRRELPPNPLNAHYSCRMDGQLRVSGSPGASLLHTASKRSEEDHHDDEHKKNNLTIARDPLIFESNYDRCFRLF